MDLTGLKCWRCVRNGYNTPAGDLDEDNKPICVFCADGEPCPEAKRKPLDSSKTVEKQVPPAVEPEKEPRPRAEKAKPMAKATTGEERFCAVQDCNKKLNSNNTTGRCFTHFYQKKSANETAAASEDLNITKKRRGGYRGPRAKKAEKAQADPINVAYALHLTEQQLDAMILRLPAETKLRFLEAELAAL
jgi:hypothetical protein